MQELYQVREKSKYTIVELSKGSVGKTHTLSSTFKRNRQVSQTKV